MKSKIFSILVFCFALITPVSASDTLSISSIYPSTCTAFDIEQGLKVPCVKETFMGPNGRLWVNPCRNQPIYQGESFFQFDGLQSYSFPSSGPQDKALAISWSVSGMTSSGTLFGVNMNLTHAFFLKPNTLERRVFSFEPEEKLINIMPEREDASIVITQNPTGYTIYRATPDHLEKLDSIETSMSKLAFPFLTPTAIAGSNLWFFHQNKGLIQYNLDKEIAEIYLWDELLNIDFELDFRLDLMIDHTGEVIIFIPEMDNFYTLNPHTRQLTPNKAFNSLLSSLPKKGPVVATFHQDESSNVLLDMRWTEFLNQGRHHSQQSVFLIDKNKQYFDYQPIIDEAWKISRYGRQFGGDNTVRVNNFLSKDFKKEVILTTDGGLFAVEIEDNQFINKFMAGWSSRGIIELNAKELLIHGDNGWFASANLEQGSSTPPREDIGQLICDENLLINALGQFIYQGEDKIWFAAEDQLVCFDKKERSCTSYPVGFNFIKFAFLNDRELALAHRQKVYIYDLVQKKVRPFVSEGSQLELGGDASEFYVSRDGTLWIASLNGLWKIDYQSGSSQQFTAEDGFKDMRLLCIHEAANGKLWIGLMDGGLHIFDPQNDTLTIIDQNDGLSNNTIVGILEDADGDKWVATFSGISVLSDQGEILFKLREKDGLSHKEFNRFSYHKMADGRLVFGTVSGINVLQSQKIKPIFTEKKQLHLYLTEISYFDPEEVQDTIMRGNLEQLSKIILPPTHRYLSLNFASSDYIHAQYNTFAYQVIPGTKLLQQNIREAGWTNMGNNSYLSLNDLPVGHHTILIRGTDHKGQLIDQIIAVPIRVKQFFYKTAWFYLLCSIPILLTAFLWVRRTLTEKKRLEAEVERRTRKIQQDKELIEQQASKMLELDEMKSRFFTNISHEFRTPLTVISGMANQVKDHPEQWSKKGIELIQRNSQHLLSLINQILDLRKLESGALQVNMIQGDIIPYLRYITESFSPVAMTNGLRIHFLTVPTALEMDYDPDKLLHVISNLLSNAIKYTPAEGDIYIQLSQQVVNEQDQLIIQVKDTGQGIPQEALPYIFDRFYQVEDLANQKPQGSGVGLALTRELVQLLQGSIKVASKPNEGTLFTLSFPISHQAPKQTFSATPVIAEAQTLAPTLPTNTFSDKETGSLPESSTLMAASTANGLPSLLIVEDNADVQLYLKSCLQEHYSLLTAENGHVGIEMALEHVPDLIISDVMMPVKNGYELCESLKKDERTSHIPIIILSAKADFESKLHGLQKKADAYLTKPFEQEELLVIINNLLEIRRQLQIKYTSTSYSKNKTFPTASKQTSSLEAAFLEKLQQFILGNIDAPDLSTDLISRRMGMSKTNIYRKLKALTGLSLSHYIRQIKLQKAKELLLDPQLNITEIAYAVGFADPHYFSRVFSEAFQQSPTEYRKN